MADVVTFDPHDGIRIGNPNLGDLNVNLNISCTNSTVTTPELAVALNLDFRTNVNASFESFVINGAINDPQVYSTVVVEDKVGLDYHNFDPLLTSVIKAIADDFNIIHAKGLNLVQKYPTLGFISGMARNSILSPNI